MIKSTIGLLGQNLQFPASAPSSPHGAGGGERAGGEFNQAVPAYSRWHCAFCDAPLSDCRCAGVSIVDGEGGL